MKAQDIRMTVTHTEPKDVFDLSNMAVERRARDYLALRLSDLLMETRASRSITDFFVEWRLDLYVATPEQFWEIVHKEAEEIAKVWCIKK